MTLRRIIWKNLSRRPARTLFTLAGVAIAVAAVVALVGVSRGIERSFNDLYQERGADLVVQRAGGLLQLSSGIDESLGDRIRALPEARQVIAGLMDLVSFPDHDLFAVIANGWAADCPVFDQIEITGRRFAPGETRVALVGRVLAANLGKKPGDSIELYGRTFQVIGVFSSHSVLENGAVFLPLAEMQKLMDRPHRVTGYVVLARQAGNAAAIESLKRKIEALDPHVQATPTAEFVAGISQIRVTRAAAWITSAIALFMGMLGVLNTMIASVAERAREIGVLRALGWRKRRIARMIVGEASALGIAGAAAGAAFGALVLQVLHVLPQTSGIVDGHLPVGVVLEAAALAMVAGIAGAAYPALWASRLNPIDALRRR